MLPELTGDWLLVSLLSVTAFVGSTVATPMASPAGAAGTLTQVALTGAHASAPVVRLNVVAVASTVIGALITAAPAPEIALVMVQSMRIRFGEEPGTVVKMHVPVPVVNV